MEQAADELYALQPSELTRERDERAKALRKEGDRDEADAVKALRKPTLAAWALNQLARRQPKEVERLLAAGEELRSAQEELLAEVGEGRGVTPGPRCSRGVYFSTGGAEGSQHRRWRSPPPCTRECR